MKYRPKNMILGLIIITCCSLKFMVNIFLLTGFVSSSWKVKQKYSIAEIPLSLFPVSTLFYLIQIITGTTYSKWTLK